MESLEVSAKSVDEAIELALQQLGAKLSEVEITILGKGRAGILGVGAEDARIRVTKVDIGRSRLSVPNFPPRPPAITYATESDRSPQRDLEDEDEEAAQPQPGARPVRAAAPPVVATGGAPSVAGLEVLQGLLDHMGFDVEVVETEAPGPAPASSGTVVAFDIRGDDLGVLIGRRGQTLSSLQYLINLMVNRRLRNPAAVVVDVEGYRARRYQSLQGLAQRMADRVRSSGQTVTLEPMNAAERRIIHLTLQDYRDVTTQSVGEGESRKVSIVPRRRGGAEGPPRSGS